MISKQLNYVYFQGKGPAGYLYWKEGGGAVVFWGSIDGGGSAEMQTFVQKETNSEDSTHSLEPPAPDVIPCRFTLFLRTNVWLGGGAWWRKLFRGGGEGADRAEHACRSSQQSSLLCRSLNFTVTLTLWEATPSHTSSCWLRSYVPSWRPPVRTSRSHLQRVGCS